MVVVPARAGDPPEPLGGQQAPVAPSPGSWPETARYWQHAEVPGVDLLRARFVTHRYSRHAHETYTFAVIEAGVEVFEYGGSLLRAGTGAVALLNPEVVHTGQAESPAGWAYRVLYPAAGVVAGVAADLGWRRGTPSFPQTVVDDPRSARLLRAAHVAAERGDRLASSSLLRAALAGLLSAHAGPGRLARQIGRPPKSHTAVRTARDLLTDRLADPPSLDDLALATGMSPFTLLRVFRGETGLPPHAYLNQLRVRLARRLLDGGMAPAEVAAEVGFADQAHLTRHFKRAMGVPPGAYQRERGSVVLGAASGGRSRGTGSEPGTGPDSGQERTRPGLVWAPSLRA